MDMDVGGDGKAVAMVPMGKAAVDRSSQSTAPPATAAAALSHASLREREELSRQLHPVLPVTKNEDGDANGAKSGSTSPGLISGSPADDEDDLKQVMGIITMEDIIECLLGTQIMDEADTVTQEMVAANWSSGGSGVSTKTDAKVNLLSAVRTRIADEMEMDIIINHLVRGGVFWCLGVYVVVVVVVVVCVCGGGGGHRFARCFLSCEWRAGPGFLAICRCDLRVLLRAAVGKCPPVPD